MSIKTALVLSGGGARGMAHIGVIEELEKRGYEIVSVTGTSMGSVVGAVYAMGKLEEFKAWLCSLDKLKVFRLMDFTLSKQGLLKGEKVLNRMKEFMEDRNIEDLDIPYAAVAVDLLNKREIVFREGKVYDAIRASIAIPGILTPVKTKDMLLVDGGVMDNVPVRHVQKCGDELIVAVEVNGGIRMEKESETKEAQEDHRFFLQKQLGGLYAYLGIKGHPKSEEKLGYLDLINRTISLMTHEMGLLSLAKYPPDILIEVSGEGCGTFDFYKAEEIVERGRKAAARVLREKH
ncbi:MAG: patatin-like phospholipase family protein [Bacteroidales bacterium]|nr:patatin-like phospholipase family protein [Bacteroidales bacterium]MDT8432136.1 patatin-like phospholipase family protein [Bacteroidales bacterium]